LLEKTESSLLIQHVSADSLKHKCSGYKVPNTFTKCLCQQQTAPGTNQSFATQLKIPLPTVFASNKLHQGPTNLMVLECFNEDNGDLVKIAKK
jgi:hypothetical protein